MKLTKEGIAVIEGDNYLSADIEREGRLDVAREGLLQYKPYIHEGGVVLDIGACLGDYTATFSEFIGPSGWVHAFEPNPPVLDCLCHNMAGYKNVVIYDIALGECRRRTSIVLDHNNIGASYLYGAGGIRVEPLDDLNFQQIDFIKIDAEGYEPLVLEGAQETLIRLKPILLVEIDTRALGFQGFNPDSVYRWLDKLGYKHDNFQGPHGDVLCVPVS